MTETTLHPRPRLTRTRWVDLNGPWGFAHDDADRGLEERWYEHPERFDRQIQVPFPPESELSGINDKASIFPASSSWGTRLAMFFA